MTAPGGSGRLGSAAALAALTGAVLAGVAGGGCSDDGATAYPDGGAASDGLGVGGACTSSSDCRAGLACNAGTCQPCACSPSGGTCVINDECATGCTAGRPRRAARRHRHGGRHLRHRRRLRAGLRCDLVGLGAECGRGHRRRRGALRRRARDCYGGLVCTGARARRRTPGSPPFGTPRGRARRAPTSPARRRPTSACPAARATATSTASPSPTTSATTGRQHHLSGHPTPGTGAPRLRPRARRYIADLEATVDGFSTYPTVFFRFSAPVDINGTLKGPGAVRFARHHDAGRAAVELGLELGRDDRDATRTSATTGWASARATGGSLTPGHTYAVVIASRSSTRTGSAILPSTDLDGPARRDRADRHRARPAVAEVRPAPRVELAQSIDRRRRPSSNATVFTVGHPAAIGPNARHRRRRRAAAPDGHELDRLRQRRPLRARRRLATAPAATPDPRFAELHAMVTPSDLPAGHRAVSDDPSDGGDLVLAANGVPQLQRSRAGLHVADRPEGHRDARAAAGRCSSTRTAPAAASAATSPRASPARMARQRRIVVLGIDQVEHGHAPRQRRRSRPTTSSTTSRTPRRRAATRSRARPTRCRSCASRPGSTFPPRSRRPRRRSRPGRWPSGVTRRARRRAASRCRTPRASPAPC